MIRNDNTFALLLTTKEGEPFADTRGEPIAAIPVTVDFDPAREHTWFKAVREGTLEPTDAADAVIHPTWYHGPQADANAKGLVSGFRVELVDSEGRGLAESTFGITYLTADARRISAVFVDAGQLKSGETFLFKVFAYPKAQPGQTQRGIKIKSLASSPLNIKTDRPLADYLERSEAFENAEEEDYPVLIPSRMLEDIAREVRDAVPLETGGTLIMELRRCPRTQRLFSVLTTHMPSQMEGELTRLTYTAETWDDARMACELRAADERLGGWYHSHSYLHEACKTCKKRDEGTCKVSADFLSEQDLFLQRTVFPQAFSVALVASNSPCTGLKWALFGWNQGRMRRRGFYIVDELPGETRRAAQGSPARVATTVGQEA